MTATLFGVLLLAAPALAARVEVVPAAESGTAGSGASAVTAMPVTTAGLTPSPLLSPVALNPLLSAPSAAEATLTLAPAIPAAALGLTPAIPAEALAVTPAEVDSPAPSQPSAAAGAGVGVGAAGRPASAVVGGRLARDEPAIRALGALAGAAAFAPVASDVFDGASPGARGAAAESAASVSLSPPEPRTAAQASRLLGRRVAAATGMKAALGVWVLSPVGGVGSLAGSLHGVPPALALALCGLMLVLASAGVLQIMGAGLAFLAKPNASPAAGVSLARRRPIDWPALLGDRRVLLVGEAHTEYAHYTSLTDSLAELKRAGVTHVALEAVPSLAPFLGALEAVFQPERHALVRQARRLGLQVIAVDGKGDTGARNGIMAANIETVLRADPRAKVLYPVGANHLKVDPWVSVRLRLERDGFAATSVLAMSATGSLWYRDALAVAIARAGLENERFAAPVEGSDAREFDFVAHLPERLFGHVTRPAWLWRRWRAAD